MAVTLSPSRKLPKRTPKSSKPQEAKKNAPSSPESLVEEATSSAFAKKITLSAETLQKLFTAEKPTKEIEKLKQLIASRVKDGRRFSLSNWRVYAAIDEAYNAPFNQITPTLIGKILAGDKKLTPDEIIKQLRRWGLSEDTLFTEITHPKNPSQKVKVLNKETFHKVLVPLVKSLLNARESKLVTDRDNYPNFVYAPNKQTEESKAVGDIITQIVETMSVQYGFKAVRRAAIHQALKYSFSMAFPAEAWHYETDVDDSGDEYTKKEGMRYNIPHPTRCGFDQNFRPGTFNTDTGCEWACWWRLNRFGDIDTNPVYYNKDKVQYGSSWSYWFSAPYEAYFQDVYPCTMAIPGGDIAVWGQQNKREELAAMLYNSGDYDKAVFTTEMFMKLSPKQWGLGEYKHKIWFRFVLVNDDCIVYAEPLPYCPVLYLGTDADDSTSNRTASFALEGIPWQDLVGNILSQHLLAVKQNCVKVIPYDKNQLTETQIHEISARGKESVSITWIPTDMRDMRVGQQNIGDMFRPIVFPQVNTAEIIGALNQVFNIMERALGMSAQETGGIAGHIQSATESRIIADNQSVRLDYIGTHVDEFDDAMKRQVYTAYQTFGDEEFVVYVNGVDQKVAKKLKEKYGFHFSEDTGSARVVEVKGDKSKLSVDAFISSRENKSRVNHPQIATILMQTIQVIASNETLVNKVGAEEIIRQLNRAVKLMSGLEDADFRISKESSDAAEMRKLAEEMQKFAKQIAQAATDKATMEATKESAKITDSKINEAGQAIIKEVGPAIQETGEAAVAADQKAEAAGQVAMQLEQQVAALSEVVLKMDAFLKQAANVPPPPPQLVPVNGPIQNGAPVPVI